MSPINPEHGTDGGNGWSLGTHTHSNTVLRIVLHLDLARKCSSG